MVDKTCSKCGFVGDESNFGKNRKVCRSCISLQFKARYQKDKERILKRTNDYYHAHKKEYSVKRKAKSATPEGKAKKHADYINNREKRLAQCKSYYEGHKEEHKETSRIWWKARRLRLWAEALAFFGPCACCGEDQIGLLAIDHINGNGGWLRKNAGEKTGFVLLSQFSKRGWPESLRNDYRILCHNCNISIAHFGQCVHELNNGSHKTPNHFNAMRDISLLVLYGDG